METSNVRLQIERLVEGKKVSVTKIEGLFDKQNGLIDQQHTEFCFMLSILLRAINFSSCFFLFISLISIGIQRQTYMR